jgi:hypothetical protein
MSVEAEFQGLLKVLNYKYVLPHRWQLAVKENVKNFNKMELKSPLKYVL